MLDRVELRVKAGDGGRGAIAFRREKYVPFGGPFGGDGGRGGDVIVRAEESVSTLRAYQHRRSFKAENGQPGMSKNKHGANGADLVLKVPPGTLIFEKNEEGAEVLIADLEKNGQEAIVARGGNGGFGNTHFATATNQTPRIAQPGIPGQEKIIVLEMRLIADAGIIGYPNVGKSSLLAALSAATPRIADYAFTTMEPVLGTVYVDASSFVLAEIPGLIEGAHTGKGLGHSFLRHAMRTRVLVHLLDGSSDSPLDDMIKVNNEISMFDASLAVRPQVVAINKVDLPEVSARIDNLKKLFKEAGITPLFISASARKGLDELKHKIWELLQSAEIRTEAARQPVTPARVFRPEAVDRGARVHRRGNRYIISDPDLERLIEKMDLEDPRDLEQLNEALEKMGINKTLRSAGAKSGDTVITGNMEWTWEDDENRRHGGNV